MGTFKVGLYQYKPVLGNIEDNLKQQLQAIENAKSQNIDLIIFPELSLTGYFLKDLVADVALNTKDGSPLKVLEKVSKEQGIDIVTGFVEVDSRYTYYNSAAYISSGEIKHIHRKVYLPTYGLFDEQRYFGAGDQIRAFDTRFGRMSILICEDVWHPSSGLIASQDGADFFIIPSCSPGRDVATSSTELGSADSWHRLCQSYAEFFVAYVLYCNRTGFEDGVNFWGGSKILGPDGSTLAAAPMFDEHLLAFDVDTNMLKRQRIRLPLLRDERLDLIQHELSRIVSNHAIGYNDKVEL